MVKISQSDKDVVRVEVPDIVPVSKKEVTNLQTMVEAVVSGKADEDTVVSLRKQLKDWLERAPIGEMKFKTVTTNNNEARQDDYEEDLFDYGEEADVPDNDLNEIENAIVVVEQEVPLIKNIVINDGQAFPAEDISEYDFVDA